MTPTGVLKIDKPRGLTSHQVVAAVRRALGTREVGHTGTLDPMATGLLLVTVGGATRVSRFLEAEAKTYRATLRLGVSTRTFDAEGEVVETVEVPPIERGALEAAMGALTGRIQQQVPAFSAIKVDGVRLYQRARRGEAVEAPTREVEVHSLRLIAFAPPDVELEADVSKGTYVRSLGVDLAAALGLPGHLTALRRTRIGPHGVEDALPLVDGRLDPARAASSLIPAERALEHLPAITLDEPRAAWVRHGRRLGAAELADVDRTAGGPRPILGPDGRLLAVGTIEPGASGEPSLVYHCVLAERGATTEGGEGERR